MPYLFLYRCMGITETVFTPRPPEMCPQTMPVPLSVLKEQTMREQMPKLPVGEGMCPPKVKRPVETNRLETGPPAKLRCMKGARLDSSPSKLGPRASPGRSFFLLCTVSFYLCMEPSPQDKVTQKRFSVLLYCMFCSITMTSAVSKTTGKPITNK